jgi:hypothetical protein
VRRSGVVRCLVLSYNSVAGGLYSLRLSTACAVWCLARPASASLVALGQRAAPRVYVLVLADAHVHVTCDAMHVLGRPRIPMAYGSSLPHLQQQGAVAVAHVGRSRGMFFSLSNTSTLSATFAIVRAHAHIGHPIQPSTVASSRTDMPSETATRTPARVPHARARPLAYHACGIAVSIASHHTAPQPRGRAHICARWS